MFKKIYLVLTVFTLLLVLSGCKDDPKSDYDILSDIKSSLDFGSLSLLTEDISIPTIDNENVSVTWIASQTIYLDVDGKVTSPDYATGDKEVSLTVTLSLNDTVITKVFIFTVQALDLPAVNTDYTDNLFMNFSYEDTNFIADGIGEVELDRCIDGDTAIFREDGESFIVRFLGIDTPESTYMFEPWGKAASSFTCDKLSNASSIVLEFDPSTTRTDNYSRYLAWVWYDGRLLDLELVEESFTRSIGVSGTKYATIFMDANFKTQDYDLRVFGEDDPDFDYSLEGIQITIEELVTNPDLYVGRKVVIVGVVSRKVGAHPYIQSGDFGIYLYLGSTYTTKLAQGNEVLISGLVPTYHPDIETGGLQLTTFTRENIEVLSEGNVVTPVLKTIDELTVLNVGTLIDIHDLTVIGIYENLDDDAFTLTVEDSFGNVITIRRDALASDDITANLFVIGTNFDIVAPLGRYESNFQLMIISLADVTIK